MKFKTECNESEWNMQLSNVTSVVTTRTFKSGFNPNTKNLPECQFPRQTPSGRKVRGRKKERNLRKTLEGRKQEDTRMP